MTLVQIALAVLNACAAGVEPNPEDVMTLRREAGPLAADWQPDVVAAHILAFQARLAKRATNSA